MAASSHTNRPLSPQMSNTFANALTRGLDAATTTDEQAAAAAATAADSAAKASKESGGRRKQQQKVQQQQHKEAKHPSRSLLPVTTGNNTKGALILLSPGLCGTCVCGCPCVFWLWGQGRGERYTGFKQQQ